MAGKTETFLRIASGRATASALSNPPKRFCKSPMAVDPCSHGLETARVSESLELNLGKFVRGFRPDRLALLEIEMRIRGSL